MWSLMLRWCPSYLFPTLSRHPTIPPLTYSLDIQIMALDNINRSSRRSIAPQPSKSWINYFIRFLFSFFCFFFSLRINTRGIFHRESLLRKFSSRSKKSESRLKLYLHNLNSNWIIIVMFLEYLLRRLRAIEIIPTFVESLLLSWKLATNFRDWIFE